MPCVEVGATGASPNKLVGGGDSSRLDPLDPCRTPPLVSGSRAARALNKVRNPSAPRASLRLSERARTLAGPCASLRLRPSSADGASGCDRRQHDAAS
eukprot:1795545-Pyramimonas_sp.AAC.1